MSYAKAVLMPGSSFLIQSQPLEVTHMVPIEEPPARVSKSVREDLAFLWKRSRPPKVESYAEPKRRKKKVAAKSRKKAKKRFRLWDQQDGLCWFCGTFVPKEQSTIDHLIPRAAGGTDIADNIVMSCKPCNSAKMHHSLEEYRDRKAKLANGIVFTAAQATWLKAQGFTGEIPVFLFHGEKR